MDIQGKVALITGASEGIGLAAARLFTQHGAKVALVARSTDKLNQAAQGLANSFVFTADMRDELAVRQMVEAVHKHYGRIDILVNNAGQGMGAPVERIDLEQYRAVMQLNLFSVVVAMQTVIPFMRQQGGGVILNISSGVSKMAIPALGAYASTKYALNGISLTARAELERDNIHVGIVYPSRTATDFGKNSIGVGHIRSGAGSPPAGAPAMPMSDADTAEQVADKILEAVQTEAAEVWVESLNGLFEAQHQTHA